MVNGGSCSIVLKKQKKQPARSRKCGAQLIQKWIPEWDPGIGSETDPEMDPELDPSQDAKKLRNPLNSLPFGCLRPRRGVPKTDPKPGRKP